MPGRRCLLLRNSWNFTDTVRRCLAHAREEAARLHHDYVGPEHVLLGLLRTEGGSTPAVLRALGIDPGALRSGLDAAVRPGRELVAPPLDLPYTSRAKKVLELTMVAAGELECDSIGTALLLLCLAREEKGVPALLLARLGATPEALLPVVRQALREDRTELVDHSGPGPLESAVSAHPARPEGDTEAETLFKAYEEYAKTLRAWFVAYGIGGPVLLLTNDTVNQVFRSSPLGRSIAGAFLIGVATQVVLAFLNKTVIWASYFATIRPEVAESRKYRAAAWVAEQYWIDVVADVATIGLFGWATWAAFGLITQVT